MKAYSKLVRTNPLISPYVNASNVIGPPRYGIFGGRMNKMESPTWEMAALKRLERGMMKKAKRNG